MRRVTAILEQARVRRRRGNVIDGGVISFCPKEPVHCAVIIRKLSDDPRVDHVGNAGQAQERPLHKSPPGIIWQGGPCGDAIRSRERAEVVVE